MSITIRVTLHVGLSPAWNKRVLLWLCRSCLLHGHGWLGQAQHILKKKPKRFISNDTKSEWLIFKKCPQLGVVACASSPTYSWGWGGPMAWAIEQWSHHWTPAWATGSFKETPVSFKKKVLVSAPVQVRYKPVFALQLNPWSLGRHNFWRFLHSLAHEPAPSFQMWSDPPEHLEEEDSGTSAGTLWVLEGHLPPGMCQSHRERSEGTEHLALGKEKQHNDQYTNRLNQHFLRQIRYENCKSSSIFSFRR